MNKLITNFTEKEQSVIELWKDPKLIILNEFQEKAYLLNSYGDLKYEECFGKISDEYFKQQRYYLAKPRRVVKFYQYYLLENEGEEGEWYIGERQLNGSIEFFKCCESLNAAFESL